MQDIVMNVSTVSPEAKELAVWKTFPHMRWMARVKLKVIVSICWFCIQIHCET